MSRHRAHARVPFFACPTKAQITKRRAANQDTPKSYTLSEPIKVRTHSDDELRIFQTIRRLEREGRRTTQHQIRGLSEIPYRTLGPLLDALVARGELVKVVREELVRGGDEYRLA